MKVLLLTDMPPCENFTAGLVLNKLVRFLPSDDLVMCALVDKSINPIIPNDLFRIPLLIIPKPREAALGLLSGYSGGAIDYVYELFQSVRVSKVLIPKIIKFARYHQVEALWIVLQGQTMIRLARPISKILRIPLFTQVWDPFGWWLRANQIDSLTQRRLLAEFDNVIKCSIACATASWAMSENYTKRYGVRNLPVLAGLPRELAHDPAVQPHSNEEFVIAFAGQFYAKDELSCLINALALVNWVVAGRRIRVKVMGREFHVLSETAVNFVYLGWKTQVETIQLLAESDLLYMPYWFSEDFKEEATNSFPSKLITYFASGRPVFCHAPEYSSPAKYIAQNEAGFLCKSLDHQVILMNLENAISDVSSYEKISKNGIKCFLRDFTEERMQKSFLEFIGG